MLVVKNVQKYIMVKINDWIEEYREKSRSEKARLAGDASHFRKKSQAEKVLQFLTEFVLKLYIVKFAVSGNAIG